MQLVMNVADLNRNRELSYTELTQLLEGSPQQVRQNAILTPIDAIVTPITAILTLIVPPQGFGRWIRARKQAGFREFDTDKAIGAFRIAHAGSGTIGQDELAVACYAYLQHLRDPEVPVAAVERAQAAERPLSPLQRTEQAWGQASVPVLHGQYIHAQRVDRPSLAVSGCVKPFNDPAALPENSIHYLAGEEMRAQLEFEKEAPEKVRVAALVCCVFVLYVIHRKMLSRRQNSCFLPVIT